MKIRLSKYFLTSLLLHLLLWLSLIYLSLYHSKPPFVPIQVDLISSAQKEQLLDSLREEKKIKESPVKKDLQIVDQDEKPRNHEIPEESRFLGPNNQVVKKQTVAKNRGDFQNIKQLSKPSISFEDLNPHLDIKKILLEHLQKEEESKKEEQVKSDEIQMNREIPIDHQDHKKTVNLPSTAQNTSEPNSETSGGPTSQTLDYIKELEPGLETLLSTKEFVYYTYFSRIRQQLDQYWSPKVRESLKKLFKEGRMISSDNDKITKCLVTLDKKGYLLKVQVIGNSGVYELDQAAVEAFRLAAPFPNPPVGIIDPDGTIKIRWDFVLEA